MPPFKKRAHDKSMASLKTVIFFTSTLSLLQQRRASGFFRDAFELVSAKNKVG